MTKTLTKTQLAQIQETLTLELTNLTHQLGVVQKSDKDLAQARSSADERAAARGDADSMGVERHLLAQTNTTLNSSITAITDALRRIEDGTYGHCRGCGKDIPAPRLLARPKATNCVTC